MRKQCAPGLNENKKNNNNNKGYIHQSRRGQYYPPDRRFQTVNMIIFYAYDRIHKQMNRPPITRGDDINLSSTTTAWRHDVMNKKDC